MMQRPSMPSAAELKNANSLVEGGAERLMDAYLKEVDTFYTLVSDQHRREREKEAQAISLRYLSIVCGTLLALAALAVCAFGIERGSNLTPLSAALTTIAGIAGVFLWGYRPEGRSSKSQRRNELR